VWGHCEFPNTVERLRLPMPIEGVESKAVEMPSQVWAGASDEVRVQCIPLCDQPSQCIAHGHNVVEDQEIGDEVVVFDELALLIANSFCAQCASAEGDPLEELIETFAYEEYVRVSQSIIARDRMVIEMKTTDPRRR
jgi:hypothetical protein